jgi:hypothetical protein
MQIFCDDGWTCDDHIFWNATVHPFSSYYALLCHQMCDNMDYRLECIQQHLKHQDRHSVYLHHTGLCFLNKPLWIIWALSDIIYALVSHFYLII